MSDIMIRGVAVGEHPAAGRLQQWSIGVNVDVSTKPDVLTGQHTGSMCLHPAPVDLLVVTLDRAALVALRDQINATIAKIDGGAS